MSRLARLLEAHEGKKVRPYHDTVGKLTVGIGRNISDVSFSEDEIQLMFRNDMVRAERQCERLFPTWNALSEVRKAVLQDMMFNLGPSRLRGFKKTREAIRKKDFNEASVQMLDSKWAEQVGKKMHQRAWRLAWMMRVDEWPGFVSQRMV
jgi:lysozyme